MAHPRNNVDPAAAKLARRQMKRLRKTLRLSQTEFARLVGMVPGTLNNRETGVADWKPGEVARARRRVAEHLEAGGKALATLDV